MTGLKTYYPEMGEPKPAALIEARLGYYGGHYYLTSQVELKGRGITFRGILKASELTPEAQGKVGWRQYVVTERAFKRICNEHAVTYELLL